MGTYKGVENVMCEKNCSHCSCNCHQQKPQPKPKIAPKPIRILYGFVGLVFMAHRIALSMLQRALIKRTQVLAYNRMPPEMRRFFYEMNLAMQKAMANAQVARLQQTPDEE